MVFPLKPPFSYGFPMVFPLKPPFSYGFPMVFLWFSYGLPGRVVPIFRKPPHRWTQARASGELSLEAASFFFTEGSRGEGLGRPSSGEVVLNSIYRNHIEATHTYMYII